MDDRGPHPRDRNNDDYRPRPRYDDRADEPGGRRMGLGPSPYGPSRKTDYGVELSGLLPEMSWQDVKDFFREQRLEVTHADVRFATLHLAVLNHMVVAAGLLDRGNTGRHVLGRC
jgi:hypothetical protein